MELSHPTLDTLRTGPVPDAIRLYVQGLVARHGTQRTATMMGLSRHMVTAIASGAPVYAGTRLMAIEAAKARGIVL